MDRTFLDRIACWEDTRALARTLPRPPRSEKVVYDEGYRCERRRTRTSLLLLDADAIDAGLELQAGRPEGSVLVLNLADDRMPGGCVDLGSGAQEESLFRRTNLSETLVLRRDLYPILEGQALYSPRVAVLKASEADGWRALDPPRLLSFLSVPGVKNPRLEADGRMSARDAESCVARFKTALQAAHRKGHDTVVLGAMGCGAWRCPARDVARLFARALPEFDGAFATLAFAILDSPRAVGNHAAFREVLFAGAESTTLGALAAGLAA